MARKVVITGLGATTPIGGDVPTMWKNALQGVSGARTLEDEWVEKYSLPVTFAARATTPASEVLSRVEAKRMDPSTQFAVVAAREAWADSGLADIDHDRLAVSFATGIGGIWTLLDAWDTLREKGPRRVLPMTVPMLMPNGPSAAVSLDLGARAGAHTPVSACASGTEALHQGLDMIRSGKADIVVAGGAEACIHPMPLASFASMQALSKRNDDPQRASRPYDKDRDGFVMGEGAGALVLESEEHALARGARIYAELAGTAVTADAYHITAPDPEGLGATRALKSALFDARAQAEDVVHVNAHATSTPVGDKPEYTALKAALGSALDGVAVSATKSQMGHLLGASGAVEAVLTALAVYERQAPATINLENQDPEIPLDVVTSSRQLRGGDIVALSNSFGFGGHNAVAVLRSR
ncbi:MULTISPECIES: beta-ketoacyl-ACP synthase II [unclassified Arthrobacter]|uniref:beta-ketoacyl-ACP synthase II n=1 Tax=unclassified Arthrobacter TaxID=235627 RepID=UPI0021049C2A|nr:MULTISPECIES: beta-ketoacyl-ACP synthase II [unclassified Arthrobacter]MCQ1947325.1 beta-ketoacyl-ACP synthase II [Arthrobacter sp. zg-Y1116]MCQ1986527.1 beta-ketoacyl-ACP synthase II [Arthrobacter sp. zg-Y844]MCQ1995189.1 beta-ketoacyl-ACP synthase II [Arthrobacter sp. zg-Y1171]UWX80767.1 beta-ketoacyl-ACP synthase II [Arthrobacter sp. zg-Y1171]